MIGLSDIPNELFPTICQLWHLVDLSSVCDLIRVMTSCTTSVHLMRILQAGLWFYLFNHWLTQVSLIRLLIELNHLKYFPYLTCHGCDIDLLIGNLCNSDLYLSKWQNTSVGYPYYKCHACLHVVWVFWFILYKFPQKRKSQDLENTLL